MVKGANIKLMRRSVIVLVIILLLGFGSAVLRLTQIGLVQGEELHQNAVDQQLIDTTINARRGTIYDTNMKTLAQSATVWQVVLAPINFKDDKQRTIASEGLAKILDLKQEDVFEKSKQKSYYVVLKRQIESDVRDKILKFEEEIEEKYDIKGVIDLLEDYKRYYPYGSFASSVLGFTGSDDQGLAGIEYQYDSELTGTPGRLVEAKSGNQTEMPFPYEQKIEAQDGNSLVLTIDETLQHITEKYLDKYIEEFEVLDRAVGVMMDVNTGAILAMASQEGYDLNDPFEIASEKAKEEIKALPKDEQSEAESAALSKQWRNKAVSDTYYPGSVWKIITSAMGLEEGTITEESRYTCAGSYVPFEGAGAISCHNTSGHGTQTFAQALCNSCNPAFMQIGSAIGIDKFKEYYQAFGFSEKTGIDLPGESDDIFFPDMDLTDLAVGSFGQNFSITPIQMVTAVSAVANGGTLLQPYVVRQILDSDGNVIKSTETIVKRKVISEETARIICDVLEENAISGAASNGYVQGYRIAGKTGTSEKKVDTNGNGFEDDYIASFCGFAPADDPKVAMLVFFDTPNNGVYYGSQIAAPCFADIMKEALPYLEIETQYNEEEITELDTTASNYVGMTTDEAQTQVAEDGFTPVVMGSGEKVLSQIPAADSRIPQQGTVVLYTDNSSVSDQKVEVPDLTGMQVADVNYVASQYNLNISIAGASAAGEGISKSQSISPGTKVSPGTVIKVTFGQNNNYGTGVM